MTNVASKNEIQRFPVAFRFQIIWVYWITGSFEDIYLVNVVSSAKQTNK